MLKKIKPVFKKICIAGVIFILCSMSIAVIAGSAVNNDDMKYNVGIVGSDGILYDNMPVGIGIRGDADCDEKVSVRDAALVAKYLANSSSNKNYMPGFADSLGAAMGDANADGKLNVRDAAKIATYLSKVSGNPDLGWDD